MRYFKYMIWPEREKYSPLLLNCSLEESLTLNSRNHVFRSIKEWTIENTRVKMGKKSFSSPSLTANSEDVHPLLGSIMITFQRATHICSDIY